MAEDSDDRVIRDLFGSTSDTGLGDENRVEALPVAELTAAPVSLSDHEITILEDIYAMYARGKTITQIAAKYEMLPSEVRDIILDGQTRNAIPFVVDHVLVRREAVRILFDEVDRVEDSLELARGDKATLKIKLLDGVDRHAVRLEGLMRTAPLHVPDISGEDGNASPHVIINIDGGQPIHLRRGRNYAPEAPQIIEESEE